MWWSLFSASTTPNFNLCLKLVSYDLPCCIVKMTFNQWGCMLNVFLYLQPATDGVTKSLQPMFCWLKGFGTTALRIPESPDQWPAWKSRWPGLAGCWGNSHGCWSRCSSLASWTDPWSSRAAAERCPQTSTSGSWQSYRSTTERIHGLRGTQERRRVNVGWVYKTGLKILKLCKMSKTECSDLTTR